MVYGIPTTRAAMAAYAAIPIVPMMTLAKNKKAMTARATKIKITAYSSTPELRLLMMFSPCFELKMYFKRLSLRGIISGQARQDSNLEEGFWRPP